MKIQVLVDDLDKGTVELTGASLMPYAGVVATFCQMVTDIYKTENPGPEWLEFSTDARIKGRPRARAARAGGR